MNPERPGRGGRRRSFGVNVPNLPEGKCPKATDVSPWYGVYHAQESPKVVAGLCTRGFIFLLAGYRRFLSPVLPRSCRFYPSCSAYTLEALERYGLSRGIWLGLLRLFHCQSWNPGGYDPVP